LFGLFLFAQFAWVATADPQPNQKARATLNYLINLPAGTSNRIISGQFEEITGSGGASMRNDIIRRGRRF